MEKVSASDGTTVDCGHHFCNTCEDAGPTVALKSLTDQLLQDKNFNKPLSSRVIQKVDQLTDRAKAIQKEPVDQEPIQRAKRQPTDGLKTSYEPKKSKGEKKNREEIFDIEDNVFEEGIETKMGIEEEDPSLEIVAKESHSAVQSLMSPGVVKVSNVEIVPTATPEIPTVQQVDHDQLVEDVAKMGDSPLILHKFYENTEITLSRGKAILGLCEKLSVDCEVNFAALEQYVGQLTSAIDNLEATCKDRKQIEQQLRDAEAEYEVAKQNTNKANENVQQLLHQKDEVFMNSSKISALQEEATSDIERINLEWEFLRKAYQDFKFDP